MEKAVVIIQSLEDFKNGKPLIEGSTKENTYTTNEPVTFAILEGGTQSGATSISIIIKDKNGMNVVGQITKGHFDAINSALQGAIQRFGK